MHKFRYTLLIVMETGLGSSWVEGKFTEGFLGLPLGGASLTCRGYISRDNEIRWTAPELSCARALITKERPKSLLKSS